MISSKYFNTFANRGMALETDINLTNKYYLEKNIAIIHKKPTPIKISKVSFPNSQSSIITEAFFEKKSTTDYNGIYRGKYIDFDAKEVKKNKSFSLSNLHKHQIEHLTQIENHGGISFLIVKFYATNTTYLLETKEILNFINNNNKSFIPISYFDEKGHIIKESYIPRLNYLSVIDKLYFNSSLGGKYEEKN